MSLHPKRLEEIKEQVRIAAWKKQERLEKSREEYRIYNETYGINTNNSVSKPAVNVRPQWAVILGVHFPCTMQEALQARNLLFKKVHPDQGGTNEAFMQAKNAWDEAVIYFRGHP